MTVYWIIFGWFTTDLAGRYGAPAQLVRAILSVLWLIWLLFLIFGVPHGVRS